MSNEKYQEIEDWFPSISGSKTKTYITKLDEAKKRLREAYTISEAEVSRPVMIKKII